MSIDYSATSQDIEAQGRLLQEQYQYAGTQINYLQQDTSHVDVVYREIDNKTYNLIATFIGRLHYEPVESVMGETGLTFQEGQLLISVPTFTLMNLYCNVTPPPNASSQTLNSIIQAKGAYNDALEITTILDIDGSPKIYAIKKIFKRSYIGTQDLVTHFLCETRPAGAR